LQLESPSSFVVDGLIQKLCVAIHIWLGDQIEDNEHSGIKKNACRKCVSKVSAGVLLRTPEYTALLQHAMAAQIMTHQKSLANQLSVLTGVPLEQVDTNRYVILITIASHGTLSAEILLS
jgi:hypothetical protein